MSVATKTVVVPIPVGTNFEEAIRLLIRYAGWDRALVEFIGLHDDRLPEVMLFRSKEVKTRVLSDGIDDETDKLVLHAIIDSASGIIMLNTSIEHEYDVLYS